MHLHLCSVRLSLDLLEGASNIITEAGLIRVIYQRIFVSQENENGNWSIGVYNTDKFYYNSRNCRGLSERRKITQA